MSQSTSQSSQSQGGGRIWKLQDALRRAVELAQNKNLQPKDLEEIEEMWKEQEKYLQEVRRPGSKLTLTMTEMLLDLEIVYKSGTYLGQCIRQLQASCNAFSPMAYAEKLLAKITVDDKPDWLVLSGDAVRVINRAPGIAALLGSIDPKEEMIVNAIEKRKAVRRPIKKDEIMEMQTPDQMENIEKDNESVDTKVQHIKRVLKDCYNCNGKRPLPYYKFILHPECFTKTVENMFYISFIIRDGHAQLLIQDSEFLIAPVEESTNDHKTQIAKNQMVIDITISEWRDLLVHYKVQKPAIIWES